MICSLALLLLLIVLIVFFGVLMVGAIGGWDEGGWFK